MKNLTAIIPTIVAHMVATQIVPIISVGFLEPAEALTTIIVVGINCIQIMLRTRNVP